MDYIAGHKRKRQDDADDDDKRTNQVLPVAHIPDDFSGEPLDGETYLALVRRDARRLPHVTRVPNPYAASSYVAASSGGSAIPVPTPQQQQQHDLTQSGRYCAPSAEWRASFEKRFLNFRKVCNLVSAWYDFVVDLFMILYRIFSTDRSMLVGRLFDQFSQSLSTVTAGGPS